MGINSILTLLALLSAAQADDIDFFTGSWTPVASYASISDGTPCIPYDAIKSEGQCVCGDKTNVPLLRAKLQGSYFETVSVPFIVTTGKDFDSYLTQKCKCGTMKEAFPVAVQKINDNVFIGYQKSNSKDLSAYVCVKTVPKLTDLLIIIDSVDKLLSRKGKLTCELELF